MTESGFEMPPDHMVSQIRSTLDLSSPVIMISSLPVSIESSIIRLRPDQAQLREVTAGLSGGVTIPCQVKQLLPESARRLPSQPEHGGRIECDQWVWRHDSSDRARSQ